MRTSTGAVLRLLCLVLVLATTAACSSHGATDSVDRAGLASSVSARTADTARTAQDPALLAAARAAVERDALGLKERDGAWTALNFAQGYSTHIDGSGATLTEDHVDAPTPWSVSLHATRLGRSGAMRELASSTPTAQGARVAIARAAGVSEWFAHDARGLEQGIDVATKPAGNGELVIEVAIGGLSPKVVDQGAIVELRNGQGTRVLSYGQLGVKDADGRTVPARMTVDGATIALRVQDTTAKYPIVIDPLVWSQNAQLLASDGASGDGFGQSIAVSGTTAIVGAPSKSVGTNTLQGAAYVFSYNGSSWTQQAKLVAPNGNSGQFFGGTVAIDGTTAIVGAASTTVGGNPDQGAAYVYVQSGSTWTLQQMLVAPDGAAYDAFGGSVAISGTTVLVGAGQKTVGSNAAQGAVYVFVQNGSTWTQEAMLVASDGATNDYFGTVAISGATAIVGVVHKVIAGKVDQGAAYVFMRNGSTWSQQAEIVAADGAAGDDFGASVAISGSTAIVGARDHLVGSNTGQGAAYVFVQDGSSWIQQAELVAADGTMNGHFGWSVGLSGTRAFVSAFGTSAAYVLVQNGSSWTQEAELFAPAGSGDAGFGVSVGISGTTAVVGAHTQKIGTNTNQGAAYAFTGAGTSVSVTCAHDPCVAGDTITATYSDAPGSTYDYVALALQGSPATSYGAFQYTYGSTGGTMTFSAVPGDNVVRIYSNNTTTILSESSPITVSSATPTVTTTCSTNPCVAGSTITATFSNLPGNLYDWLAITTQGAPTTTYSAFQYTYGLTSGSFTFSAIPGNDVVRVFLNNSYTVSAESSPITVSAASPTVTTTCSTNPCVVGSTITATFANLPGNLYDWLAITTQGSPTSSYAAFQYTYGAVNGTFHFTAIGGNDVVRVFLNNSYTVTAESSPITVSGPAASVTTTCSTNPCVPGSTITATFANLPGNLYDWLAITTQGSPTSSYAAFQYTYGAVNGAFKFTAIGGNDVVRVFSNNTLTLLAESSPAIAVGSGTATVSSNCNSSACTASTHVTATFSNLPGYPYDFIAVVPAGQPDSSYVAWAWTNGAVSGTVNLGTVAAGTYVVRAFQNNTLTELASSPQFTISP